MKNIHKAFKLSSRGPVLGGGGLFHSCSLTLDWHLT